MTANPSDFPSLDASDEWLDPLGDVRRAACRMRADYGRTVDPVEVRRWFEDWWLSREPPET